jgi:hypothetical protein
MTTLDRALETVMQLSLGQQELLIEILRQRHLEASRDEIAKEVIVLLDIGTHNQVN